MKTPPSFQPDDPAEVFQKRRRLPSFQPDDPEEVFGKKERNPEAIIKELEGTIQSLNTEMEGLLQEKEEKNTQLEEWDSDKELISDLRIENRKLREENFRLSRGHNLQKFMLTLNAAGIPGITCGRCAEPITFSEVLAMKHQDLESVNFVCFDCAEALKEKYPKARFAMASSYFEALTAPGRPKRVLELGS